MTCVRVSCPTGIAWLIIHSHNTSASFPCCLLYGDWCTISMRGLGFKEARRKAIAALKNRDIQFEPRSALDGKNLLATGEVLPEFVIELLQCCRGGHYQSRPHHFDRSVEVHIFRPRHGGEAWYIKLYFVECEDVEDMAVFISVHRSHEAG